MTYVEPGMTKVLDRQVASDITRLKSLKSQLESCYTRIGRYQSYGSQYYITGKDKLKNELLSGQRYDKYSLAVDSFISDFEKRKADVDTDKKQLKKTIEAIESKLASLETRKYTYVQRGTI